MSITEAPPTREETDEERTARELAEQAERLAANADPLSPAEEPAVESKPTQYVVVAMIHTGDGTTESPTNDTTLTVKVAEGLGMVEHPTQGVPFILGGHESPELYEAKSGPKQAKTAALERHPALAACVREPGLSLATWPVRSYEFKQVQFTPQPDKLEV